MTREEIEKLDPHFMYAPHPELGEFLPLLVKYRKWDGKIIEYYMSDLDYVKLNGGNGYAYVKTPWGPWCWMKFRNYVPKWCKMIEDLELIAELDAELNGYRKMMEIHRKQFPRKED